MQESSNPIRPIPGFLNPILHMLVSDWNLPMTVYDPRPLDMQVSVIPYLHMPGFVHQDPPQLEFYFPMLDLVRAFLAYFHDRDSRNPRTTQFLVGWELAALLQSVYVLKANFAFSSDTVLRLLCNST